MSLKDSWKKVGKDFASLGTDLGKSVTLSVRKGVEAASDWAVEGDKKKTEGECNCDCEGHSGCEGDCDCNKDDCDCKADPSCDCGCDCGYQDDAPQS